MACLQRRNTHTDVSLKGDISHQIPTTAHTPGHRGKDRAPRPRGLGRPEGLAVNTSPSCQPGSLGSVRSPATELATQQFPCRFTEASIAMAGAYDVSIMHQILSLLTDEV